MYTNKTLRIPDHHHNYALPPTRRPDQNLDTYGYFRIHPPSHRDLETAIWKVVVPDWCQLRTLWSDEGTRCSAACVRGP